MAATRGSWRVFLLVALATWSFPLARASAAAPIDAAISDPRTFDYVGSGIADETGERQTVETSLQPGSSRTFLVKVRNTTASTRTLRLDGPSSDELFSVTYAASDGDDITGEVTAGSYSAELEPGHRDRISVTVTASERSDREDQKEILVEARDERTGRVDTVRAIVKVPPLRVWGVNYRGTLRCTATFSSRTLMPGFVPRVHFTLTNLTRHKVSASGHGYLIFRDRDDEVLLNTEPFRTGPVPIERDLRPGQTIELFDYEARVRWSGLLVVEPVCEGLRLKMPSVRMRVTETTPPESPAAAVAAAVATPGSPFQECPPEGDGDESTGVLDPPDGRDAPPLTLRCWAEVRQEEGFYVVALNLVSPDDAPEFTIEENANGWSFSELPGEENMLAARWSFVVTDDRVRPYLALMEARANGEGFSHDYVLKDGTWSIQARSLCGHTGFAGDFLGRSFSIDWITDCT